MRGLRIKLRDGCRIADTIFFFFFTQLLYTLWKLSNVIKKWSINRVYLVLHVAINFTGEKEERTIALFERSSSVEIFSFAIKICAECDQSFFVCFVFAFFFFNNLIESMYEFENLQNSNVFNDDRRTHPFFYIHFIILINDLNKINIFNNIYFR